MFPLLAINDVLMVAFVAGGDFIVANGSKGLVNAIRDFIAPIFLLCIGIAAMTFLFQRQVTQFLQFAALAVGIAVLFYFPGVVESVAGFFAKAF